MNKLNRVLVFSSSLMILFHIISMLWFPLTYKKHEKAYRKSLWCALMALYMTTAFWDMVIYKFMGVYNNYFLRDNLFYFGLLFMVWLSIRKYNRKIAEYDFE